MVNVFEILSDEILMEIFEYFDAHHLFKAFYNLNDRFNRLVKDRRLCLKLNSKCIRDQDMIKVTMWSRMANYLTAITLINNKHILKFMSACRESDLIALRSLRLHRLRICKNKASIVKYISNLPTLKNLCIQAVGDIDVLTLAIFCENILPQLKSYECINFDQETHVSSAYGPQTSIEQLMVGCMLYKLPNLLTQTPKLQYLNIKLTNVGPADTTLLSSPLPTMTNLIHLKLEIRSVSYIHLTDLLESMPHLQSLELSGSSVGDNFDNGYRLKALFGHLPIVIIENLRCSTAARSIKTILVTFDTFWSDVTCTIEHERAYLSAYVQQTKLRL
ncbi:unnamed protein product [Adineta ricciae]|uniref:F-box domain-containing protein n=1 Tax=Adineta ricciae TaxID=249248 RepID=A0A814UH59_ADIRI|nr:unnamed protein product [Adineta ricciae]